MFSLPSARTFLTIEGRSSSVSPGGCKVLGANLNRSESCLKDVRLPPPHPSPSRLRACPLPANLKVPKPPAGRGLGGGGAERVPQASIAVPPERGACRRHRRRVRGRGEGGHRNQHGQGESSDERLHGGSPYLDRCLCFASALKAGRPAPARENMAAPAAAACDGDHSFRTIQNDSDSAACGKRGALPRPANAKRSGERVGVRGRLWRPSPARDCLSSLLPSPRFAGGRERRSYACGQACLDMLHSYNRIMICGTEL